MQRVTLVRYTAKPDHAAENEALSRAVFEELRATAPTGVAYGLFRDGLEFIHLFVNLVDESADALVQLASFKTYQEGVVARSEAPPQPTRLTVQLLDSYGFAGALASA